MEGTAKESHLCTFGFSGVCLKRKATESTVLVDNDDNNDSELDHRCPWAATGAAAELSISSHQTGRVLYFLLSLMEE